MNSIAATIGNAERRDMFYLSPDSSMTQRIWDGTGWTADWTRLGGVFRSAPAAVATMVKRPVVIETGHADPSVVPGADRHVPIPVPLVQRIDVFGLGTDYSLYHKALFGEPADSPGPWEDLGGVFTSAPAAIVLDGRTHVFGLGTDYSMYHRVWDGRTWSPGWDRLGGFFSSAPSVVSWGKGRLDLFARGADFTLRHRALENDAWLTDWQNLGGNLASPPVAVSWGPSRLDVFAIGHDDGGVVHKWWDGMIWNDWEHVAGSKDLAFPSMPAAAGCAVNRLDVVVTGCDGKLYHISSVDDVWSKPQSLDGQIASTPTLLVPAVNELQLIAPGNDGNLYHKQWKGSWQSAGWQQLGDHLRLPSRYYFSVDHLRVLRARSFNSDTDTGQCSLAVGNWPTTLTQPGWPFATKTQAQGDLGGTAVKEGATNLMNFGPVTVEPCESAIFNYTFVNTAEKDPSVVNSQLTQQAIKLADSGVQTVAKDIAAGVGITAVELAEVGSLPLMGSLLGILGPWLIKQLNDILHANCDGVVAVEQIVRMGKELNVGSRTVIHNGSDSNVGCGKNSQYEVAWSITGG